MKLDAIKRQGKRANSSSDQLGQKPEVGEISRNIIADSNGESSTQVQRYIRLTYLVPEILKKVDEKSIAFNPAVELSYLPKEAQKTLLEAMEVQQCTPSLSQAQRLKTLHQQGTLELDMIFKILGEAKANQREKISFSHERLQKYFPKGYTPQQIEESIIKMLEERQKKIQRERGKER
jgi:ParB family chromosome partitioning protein